MSKVTPEQLKLGLEEKGKKWFPTYKGVTFYDEDDIHQRIAQLLNQFEEKVDKKINGLEPKEDFREFIEGLEKGKQIMRSIFIGGK